MKINVVIIEDEAVARDHLLKMLLQINPEITVVTSIATVSEGIDWFSSHKYPDLIFMDIQLSDGISFTILEEVTIDIPIIFITAYDEYAIKAFKTTGIDYLLKPISNEDLEKALEKFYKIKSKVDEEWSIRSIDLTQLIRKQEKPTYKERFLLRSGNSMIPIRIDDIAYFYRDELVFAKLFDEKSFPLDHSLNQLQKMINPEKFIRLNRQLLVNVNAIKKLIPSKPGQLSVLITPDYHEDVSLSPERSRWLKRFLDGDENT